MTPLDWLIVIVANGAIVGYGLYLARGTTTSYEWFLAAKGLPWWIVGLSMFATAVDSGDYVAVVGGAYTFGLSNPLGLFRVHSSCSAPPFDPIAIRDAANDALAKSQTDCINSKKLKRRLKKVFKKVVIKCNPSLSACGKAWPGRIPVARWFRSSSFNLGPNPNCNSAGTVLHEAVHRTQTGFASFRGGVSAVEEKAFACQQSCYGTQPDFDDCDCK